MEQKILLLVLFAADVTSFFANTDSMKGYYHFEELDFFRLLFMELYCYATFLSDMSHCLFRSYFPIKLRAKARLESWTPREGRSWHIHKGIFIGQSRTGDVLF